MPDSSKAVIAEPDYAFDWLRGFRSAVIEQRFQDSLRQEQRFAFWGLWLFGVLGLALGGAVLDMQRPGFTAAAPTLWIRACGLAVILGLGVMLGRQDLATARPRLPLLLLLVTILVTYTGVAIEYGLDSEVNNRRFWYPLLSFFCFLTPLRSGENLALACGLLLTHTVLERALPSGSMSSLILHVAAAGAGVATLIRFQRASRQRWAGVLAEQGERARLMEHKQGLEGELRRSQRVQVSGQIAAGVAHDFNNVLQIIASQVEYARAIAREDPELSSTFDDIEQAVERAAELSGDMLRVGRRDQEVPRAVSINALLKRHVALMPRVLGRSLGFEVEACAESVRVVTKAGALDQALLNLSLNARDAMPEGGVIRYSTRFESGDESALILEVSDNGAGMDSFTRARAFDPFFTTKSEGRGSGLGLAMVKRFAESCGGRVDLESEHSVGTRVSLRLPGYCVDAESVSGEPEENELIGGSETVLLIEDEPAVRTQATRFLERCGYRVLEASDGLEALTLFETERSAVDLVMTDVDLPAASGFEVYDRVREGDADCPVLFTSALDVSSEFASIATDPRVDLLVKPYRGGDLGRSVRALLER